jgi:hypothetical protein
MATGTIYLDVDDEITSAAARIRGSEATKVALVVPYGSRIATSRMNFRLLAREAVVNNRRLSIVAADAATRALAASAGLPVFANVAEYDAAAPGGGAGGGGGESPAGAGADEHSGAAGAGANAAASAAAAAAAASSAGAAAGVASGLEASETVVIPPAEVAAPSKRRSRKAAQPVSDETQAIELPFGPAERSGTAVAAAGAGAVAAAATPASTAATTPAATPASTAPTPASAGATPDARPRDRSAGPMARPIGPTTTRVSAGSRVTTRRVPTLPPLTLPRVGGSAVVIGAALVLMLIVAGVAAFVFLPSAEITVTPRSEPIGPISLVVRADPEATAVDPEAAVVPADRVEVPVEVTDTFTTAGRRIEETKAAGSVTFSNLDFTSSNTIPAGSVVSTQSGVRFALERSVTVARAKLVGLQIVPTEADAPVTAVKAGTAGNVEPNTILVIPADEDPLTLKVRNRAATTGGTHEEFPQVSQADIDAALKALAPKLTESFQTAVEGGEGAPQGATPFPETAVLGDATPTVDAATLLGQEVATFDLGLRATGTVIAVDDTPVESIAETRLLANVGSDHRLVDGSIDIVPGEPTVENGQVSFPVTARAERVPLLDPADLLARVKGQTVDQAKATLAPFGEVEIRTWPEWVTTITGIDSRVSLVVAGQTDAAPGASGAPSSSAEPASSASPSGSASSAAAPAAS